MKHRHPEPSGVWYMSITFQETEEKEIPLVTHHCKTCNTEYIDDVHIYTERVLVGALDASSGEPPQVQAVRRPPLLSGRACFRRHF